MYSQDKTTETDEIPPSPRISRRKWIKRGLLGFATLTTATTLDAFVIEPNRLTVETPELTLPNLPKAFDGYRIALLADIHYPRTLHPNYIKSAVSLATSYNPDVMVFAGDIDVVRFV